MTQNKNLYVIVGGMASMVVFALFGFWIGGSSIENYSEQYSPIPSSNDAEYAVEAAAEECTVEAAVEETVEQAW